MATSSDKKSKVEAPPSKTQVVHVNVDSLSGTHEVDLSKDGFRGWLRLHYKFVGNEFTLSTTQYKIDKGDNHGGNKANYNVTMLLSGTLSIDNDMQNNTWHTWASSVSKLSHGTEVVNVEIIFDKDAQRDPRVNKGYLFSRSTTE